MSLPRYPEYKDSGVAWLGEVPVNWELKRLGYFFEERREKVSDKDYPALSVTKNGIVPQIETAAKTDDGDNRKKVCAGDFVINSRSDRKGSSGISPFDGSVSLINTILRPREQVFPAYIHHLLRSVPFQEEFYRYGKGIVADLWSTNYSEMSGITLAMPTAEEQTAIATFLDRETAKIDALIAEQEKLLTLLAEKRQATISHAVTKGLNPDAPMKDSGVEWLGEVPAHWEVTALKHLVRAPIIDGPHETPIKQDNGIPFVSAESLSKGFIDFTKIWGYISPEDHARYSRRYTPKQGDILIVKLGATTGTTAIVDTEEEFNIWVPLAAVRLKDGIDPQFVCNVLKSSNLKRAYELNWTYGTQQTLGLGTISNLQIPVPPISEQKDIVIHFNSIFPLLDSLQEEARRSIDLLKERRAALISAAVTGKIDVRAA